MLVCEGYRMFRGIMQISPVNMPPYQVEATWLYKPEFNCWYGGGRSYVATICTVVRDNTL